MLLLHFLVKKNIGSFSLTSHKPPVQRRASWRKACMLGSKRPNQREGTTRLPQSSTYLRSESVWTRLGAPGPKKLPKTHKSHFIVVTTSWTWSHCSHGREHRHWNHSAEEWERGNTDLGWPVMSRLLTGRGGWAGGSERPTGASSQIHAQRQASNLKDKDTAG